MKSVRPSNTVQLTEDDDRIHEIRSHDFITPTKASGEAQKEEEINPTILEATKTLSKVTSHSVNKTKSTNKGKRYRRIASSKVDTGRTSISSSSIIHSPKKGQREGKAQMVEEDIQATHKTKEQIRQEEAGLEEAIRLQAQMDEEDWDTIRVKLEANTKVVQESIRRSISNDDFAKRMVEMINEKKKFYADKRLKHKERLKTEFEKLMKSIESFVPMETEARVKRHGLQLEQETSKKQKIDIEDASITKGKDEVVKEEEAEVPVKKQE
ncbi:hypothetical protein Tco_0322930 [Tanacetum coccineum]